MSGLVSGQMLGSYHIEEALGEGGFATVYRAYQPSLERAVAIKVLDEKLARNPQFLQRFRQEAEATFSLQHPNIVRVFDFVEQDGACFMVMEYVDGPTLRRILKDHGSFDVHSDADATRLHEDADDDLTILRELTQQYQPLEIGVIGQIARDVLRGLDYAHRQGVIHRDIKPDNVLIGSDGIARLADFGIARVQEESRLTRTGLRIGTIAYMSPEQISGRRDLDGRSDIYSFGIMLYEMLTGAVPFTGTDTAIWSMHMRDEPLPPSKVRADVPSIMEEITLKCLAKEPRDRFASAEELVAVIERSIHLTPLSGIKTDATRNGSGQETVGEDKTQRCPQCGYEHADSTAETCPVCMTRHDGQKSQLEKVRIENRARRMIQELSLPLEASMDVRDYEYKRTLRPHLEKMITEVSEHWRRQLRFGAVISPASPKEERPTETELIKCMAELNETASLLSTSTFSAFIFTVEAKREKRRMAANLKGMAMMLAGTLQSLIASKLENPEGIREAYKNSLKWFNEAASLVQESNPDFQRAATLSAALVSMILDFPHSRQVSEDVQRMQREAKGIQGGYEFVGLGQAVINDYQNSYLAAQERMAELRRKIQNCIERGRQRLDAREGQKREIHNSIDRAKKSHAREVEETRDYFESELGKLPGKKIFAQALALAGPLLLGIIMFLLYQSSYGSSWITGFKFLGLTDNYMPLIVTAGMLSLGFVLSKNVRTEKVAGWDIPPLIMAILGSAGMTAYWAGFALTYRNLSFSVILQIVIAVVYFIFICGLVFLYYSFKSGQDSTGAGDETSDTLKEPVENLLRKISRMVFPEIPLKDRPYTSSDGLVHAVYRSGSKSSQGIGCMVIIGLIIIVTPIWVEIRAFKLGTEFGAGMQIMNFGRPLLILLGYLLGLYLTKLESEYQVITSRKTHKLHQLEAEQTRLMTSLQDKLNGVDRSIRNEVQKELGEADGFLLELHDIAERLSRRLLRTRSTADLADSRELDQKVIHLRADLGKL